MSSPRSSADTLVARILGGEAPLNVRTAAARGALPLPRVDLARLFVLLLKDEESEIRDTAARSLAELPPDAVRELVTDATCAPEVLLHYAGAAAKDKDDVLAEPIIFNEGVPDAALHVLAEKGNAKIIDLVLTNQQRLLTTKGLLDRLTVNPALRNDQRGRVLELLERLSKAVDAAAGEEVAEAGATAADDFDPEEAARLLDVDVGELFAASEIMGGEELAEAEDPAIRSAYEKIVTLNTAQKAVLAMKGGREERMILIRDTNKIVALSVLKNPRMNENDVEQIAMMRNVSDDVLRTLGANREWTKQYQVVKNLIHNPRTPPGISTNFISRLQNRDLKSLARDRNVPELVRKMAKRVYDTRTQQRGPSFRRG